MAITVARPAERARRIDTDALKQAHPIEDVVARYGIELKRQGRALAGRCPFHADGGEHLSDNADMVLLQMLPGR